MSKENNFTEEDEEFIMAVDRIGDEEQKNIIINYMNKRHTIALSVQKAELKKELLAKNIYQCKCKVCQSGVVIYMKDFDEVFK